jgi:hypothetical protein
MVNYKYKGSSDSWCCACPSWQAHVGDKPKCRFLMFISPSLERAFRGLSWQGIGQYAYCPITNAETRHETLGGGLANLFASLANNRLLLKEK